MSVIDVIKACYDSIEQIAEHIEDAIVYTDAGCTESFQFIGAYPLLVEHGARAVCSLENMSPFDVVSNWSASSEPARKLVIMTSRLLSDAHRYILRCLSKYQGFKHCFIFTSISEEAHSAYPDLPLGPDAFREYESLLLQDYEELLNKHNKESAVSEDMKNERDLASEEEGRPGIDENARSDRVNSSVAGVLYGDDTTTYQESDEKKLVVTVSHFPMIYCALSPKTFVLPSGGSFAEAPLSAQNVNSLSTALPPLSLGVSSDGEDVIPGATLTAHFLHQFASKMDLKLEIFSFGDLSKTIGRILTDMPSLYDMGRRKKSAGLLLVDRTLDLLTPCCHGDSFFDRIFSVLPRREILSKSLPPQPKQNSRCVHRASLDVQIPLDNIILEDAESDKLRLLDGIEAILCGWNSKGPQSKIQDLLKLGSEVNDHKSYVMAKDIMNGSFVSAEHFRGTPYLEAVLDRRMKDGAILVKKWLQETLRKDNIMMARRARPGSATKPELEALLKTLVKNDHSLLRNKGIAQLAAATLACLDEAEAAKWDAFMSAEKMLKISAGDTSQNLAAQMVDLINKTVLTSSQQKGATSNSFSQETQGLISFQDALLLTCIGYILAGENFPTSGSSGPFSWQEEQILKEAIVDAIFENPEAAELKFVHGVTEELKAYRSRICSKDGKEVNTENELSIDDFDDDQWGKWGDEEDDDDGKKGGDETYSDLQLKLELRYRVDNLFKFLHKLSSLKVTSIPLREASLTLDAVISGDFYENKGLLYKILTTVLAKRDLPGLEHHSSAVGRLFKSGFGRLGLGQSKPNLADQNVIFIFVVGGLNGVEVREAFEALSESGRPDVELIVGGTTLLTPSDMREILLGEMSFL